jgi:hypothetical protein
VGAYGGSGVGVVAMSDSELFNFYYKKWCDALRDELDSLRKQNAAATSATDADDARTFRAIQSFYRSFDPFTVRAVDEKLATAQNETAKHASATLRGVAVHDDFGAA